MGLAALQELLLLFSSDDHHYDEVMFIGGSEPGRTELFTCLAVLLPCIVYVGGGGGVGGRRGRNGEHIKDPYLHFDCYRGHAAVFAVDNMWCLCERFSVSCFPLKYYIFLKSAKV